MLTLRAGATAFALIFASSLAFAQAPDSKQAAPGAAKTETHQTVKPKAAAKTEAKTEKSTTASATDSVKKGAEDVKTWTRKQWNSMKAEWQKDKAKWNSCDAQSKAKKLKGKNSWSFFYDCMKA